jgi:hypothetical protein
VGNSSRTEIALDKRKISLFPLHTKHMNSLSNRNHKSNSLYNKIDDYFSLKSCVNFFASLCFQLDRRKKLPTRRLIHFSISCCAFVRVRLALKALENQIKAS